MSEVKRYMVDTAWGMVEIVEEDGPSADGSITIDDLVVHAADYERMEQAYQMMDTWFYDAMTQNQVDIIDAILNGGK